MTRLRGERRRQPRQEGAASVEYLGALLVAAALLTVALVAVSPLGRPLTTHVVRAVCSVFQLPGCLVAGAGQNPLQRATSGRYVALGDSFSSGEGAGGYQPGTDFDDRDDLWPFNDGQESHNRCRRSANAYSQVLAAQNTFAAGTTFVACSGAVLADLSDPNRTNTGEPAQLDHLDDDVSLVTMTMSGNDLGFGAVLTDCVLNGQRGVSLVSTCQERHQDRIDDALPRIGAALVEQYRQIAAEAPNARVVIIGYPPLFEADADSYRNLLFVEDQVWMNEQAEALNATLRAAALEAGVEFVDVTALFADHGIGSDEPWFNDLDFGGPGLAPVDPGSFHPNGQGQAAIAEAVQRQLENPRTP